MALLMAFRQLYQCIYVLTFSALRIFLAFPVIQTFQLNSLVPYHLLKKKKIQDISTSCRTIFMTMQGVITCSTSSPIRCMNFSFLVLQRLAQISKNSIEFRTMTFRAFSNINFRCKTFQICPQYLQILKCL
jgi:hypothetical protein